MSSEKKISDLDTVPLLNTSALFEIEQGGVSYKVDLATIQPVIIGISSINTDTTDAQTLTGQADKIIITDDLAGDHTFTIGTDIVTLNDTQTLANKTLNGVTMSGDITLAGNDIIGGAGDILGIANISVGNIMDETGAVSVITITDTTGVMNFNSRAVSNLVLGNAMNANSQSISAIGNMSQGIVDVATNRSLGYVGSGTWLIQTNNDLNVATNRITIDGKVAQATITIDNADVDLSNNKILDAGDIEASAKYTFTGDTDTFIRSGGANIIDIFTGSVERIIIDASAFTLTNAGGLDLDLASNDLIWSSTISQISGTDLTRITNANNTMNFQVARDTGIGVANQAIADFEGVGQDAGDNTTVYGFMRFISRVVTDTAEGGRWQLHLLKANVPTQYLDVDSTNDEFNVTNATLGIVAGATRGLSFGNGDKIVVDTTNQMQVLINGLEIAEFNTTSLSMNQNIDLNQNNLVDVNNINTDSLTIINAGIGLDPVISSNSSQQRLALTGSLLVQETASGIYGIIDVISAANTIIRGERTDNIAGSPLVSIQGQGADSVATSTTYGEVVIYSQDLTNGAEQGRMFLNVRESGANTTYIGIQADTADIDIFRDLDMAADILMGGNDIDEINSLGFNFSTQRLQASGTGLEWQIPSGDTWKVSINSSTQFEVLETTTKVNNLFTFANQTELTIASGVVTITQNYHTIDTEADAGTDDLDTINGGSAGQVILLRANNSSRTVVAKDGTGNLRLSGDFSMDNNLDTLTLLNVTGDIWLELSRSDNAA